MLRRNFLAGSALALSGCAGWGPFPGRTPPEVGQGEVTSLHVLKGKRLLRLEVGGQVVREYRVGLGFEPDGPKFYQGDGRTPEGLYRIDRRNPQSAYHLALGVSYPSPQDRLRARKIGRPLAGTSSCTGLRTGWTRSRPGTGPGAVSPCETRRSRRSGNLFPPAARS